MRPLKREFLELLEKNREFRYAVAGYLGLDEILKRLDKHDEKFNEILSRLDEHDRKFNEILATLKEHTAILKEHTARLDEHDRKFNEILAVLKEHTAILKEHTAILKEHTARLNEHDRKFNEIIAEIRDLKVYIERISLTLEEEAWEVITGRLRKMGIQVKLERLVLPDLEVNIYGAADNLCIVGEASTRAGARVVKSVDEKLDLIKRKYPEYLRDRVLKVVYTMWATEDAIEEAKKRGIWLLKALEELTPPNL
jgi:nitrate reductase assembly molybdenum cofactor insertion protein NarJ